MSVPTRTFHGVTSAVVLPPAGLEGWIHALASGATETSDVMPSRLGGAEPRAVGLVWPAAPSAAEIVGHLCATLTCPRIGYLDAAGVMLPWRSVVENLVWGTGTAPDARLAREMLAVAGLASVQARRAHSLSRFDRLVVALGRAMLLHPDLLVLRGLAANPAAADNLRTLARIEGDFGYLSGCPRLHVVARRPDAAVFCDTIFPAPH